ncbi:hypothetical protein C8R45DRAFT_947724 [Mycena sanguinolenta]|nr:hypothetical protein C8R45DRAFT_947724 [Mycena sanguinolenta]
MLEEEEIDTDPPGEIDMDVVSTTAERKIGDLYDPALLPEVRGSRFKLQFSRLVQRDYKDIDGTLICPLDLNAKLTEGTLVLVMLKFVTYVMKDQKNKKGEPQPDKKAGAFNFDSLCIYHALIHKLRILDYGNGAKFIPPVPTAPKSRFSPQTPTKRQRDAAANAAFDSFGCKTSPSPTKRTRLTKTA